jgi:uncharacterized membrane protein (DUF2068 family)
MNLHRNPSEPKGTGWIIGMLLFACIATTAYWVIFFTTGDVQARSDPVYIAFESAFPLADGWMALCALGGAVGLWRKKDWGFLFGLLAGSSSIFLGLMDVLFNINEGNYALGGPEMAVETAINITTLGFGILVIVYLWRNRSRLCAAP